MTRYQKNALIAATKRHEKLDMLVRGTYGKGDNPNGWRGCSIGCLARDINPDLAEDRLHNAVAEHYGIPVWLVFLQDALFENADVSIHTKLAKAIKPREEWRSVMYAIHRRVLQEVAIPKSGASSNVVLTFIDFHKNETPAWSAARSAARSAVEAAAEAESAAWLKAKSEIWSEAWSEAWKSIMHITLEEITK